MKCELKRDDDDDNDDDDDSDDDDYYEETMSPIPDIEDISHREVERYNHKPVIDLVVLKSFGSPQSASACRLSRQSIKV